MSINPTTKALNSFNIDAPEALLNSGQSYRQLINKEISERGYFLLALFQQKIKETNQIYFQPAHGVAAIRFLASQGGSLSALGETVENIFYFLFLAENGNAVPLGNESEKNSLEVFRETIVLAHKNDPQGYYRLARLFLTGSCAGFKNVTRGIQYLEKAAAQNNPPALSMLGAMQIQGMEGVPTDTQKGLANIMKAADAEHPEAMRTLAEIYYRGALLPKDEAKSIQLMEKAAHLMDGPACFQMALRYYKNFGSNTYPLVIKYLEDSLVRGNLLPKQKGIALYLIGQCYELGMHGAPKCLELAAKYYKLSANLGHTLGIKMAKRFDPQTTCFKLKASAQFEEEKYSSFFPESDAMYEFRNSLDLSPFDQEVSAVKFDLDALVKKSDRDILYEKSEELLNKCGIYLKVYNFVIRSGLNGFNDIVINHQHTFGSEVYQAIDCLEAAAKKRHPRAQICMAYIHRDGIFLRKGSLDQFIEYLEMGFAKTLEKKNLTTAEEKREFQFATDTLSHAYFLYASILYVGHPHAARDQAKAFKYMHHAALIKGSRQSHAFIKLSIWYSKGMMDEKEVKEEGLPEAAVNVNEFLADTLKMNNPAQPMPKKAHTVANGEQVLASYDELGFPILLDTASPQKPKEFVTIAEKNYSLARKYLEQALKWRGPNNEANLEAMVYAGEVNELGKIGIEINMQHARGFYERVLKLANGNPAIQEKMRTSLARLETKEKAEKKDPAALIMMGLAYRDAFWGFSRDLKMANEYFMLAREAAEEGSEFWNRANNEIIHLQKPPRLYNLESIDNPKTVYSGYADEMISFELPRAPINSYVFEEEDLSDEVEEVPATAEQNFGEAEIYQVAEDASENNKKRPAQHDLLGFRNKRRA